MNILNEWNVAITMYFSEIGLKEVLHGIAENQEKSRLG